jgi:DNA-binding response OmpR family regulator
MTASDHSQPNSKLLIIDDDHDFSEALRYNLNLFYQNYQIILAESGEIGLKEIRNNGFSLILLDLIMPGMNGAEVLKQIRQMEKYYNVVILTAYAEDALMQQVKNENPEKIIDKVDFTMDMLSPFL